MKPSPARASRWITIPRPQPAARLRLVCFPHAGGGASTYYTWGAGLERASIEVRSVQYPGRETRFAEPCIDNVPGMVEAIADQWTAIAGPGPCALYGHSMGAILAFEVAARLARRPASAPPVRLFVSGHQAPDLPYRAPQLRRLPDAELLAAAARHFGGIPVELRDDPEIAAVFAPILRADLTLIETYLPRAILPLAVPISAFGGMDDPWAKEDEMLAWARCTAGGFHLRRYPGNHFFHQQNRELIWEGLCTDLHLDRPHRPRP